VSRYRAIIDRLREDGWVVLEGDRLRPTEAGLLLADDLAVAFL
jgi:coproporphyrinogen III oxidase-like Fe-S oxidoreductase